MVKFCIAVELQVVQYRYLCGFSMQPVCVCVLMDISPAALHCITEVDDLLMSSLVMVIAKGGQDRFPTVTVVGGA